MASSTLIPVSEYLATLYRPDCDYIDGELLERNLGEREHSFLQAVLIAILFNQRKAWDITVLSGQRVQVAATRYRVPDICVLSATAAADAIAHEAPLLCIEILSKDDSLSAIGERVDDYIAMGVRNIWIFDPIRHRAWFADASGFHIPPDGLLSIAGTPIQLLLAGIFAELDSAR